jgi:transcriptional regulator with XRE-family HTH domain
MNAFYKEFGRLLREKRETSGAPLTQQELAERVSLSRTSITNIELGKQHISLYMLFSLARALQVDPQQLLPASKFAKDDGVTLLKKVDRLNISKASKELLQKTLSPSHQTERSST